MKCFFCDVQKRDDKKIIDSSENFFVRMDDFPVTTGHCEIVSKKHIASLFELDEKLFNELFLLIKKSKKYLDKKYTPDSYNLGVNDGKEAGQTIPHLHIHLIPRYKGDIENPEGGIRGVIPDKKTYT